MSFIERIKNRLIKDNGLLVSLVITLTLFILGPISVFFSNYYGLQFSLYDLMSDMALPFIITTFLLMLIIVVTPNKFSKILLSLLLMIGVAFWLQGVFLTFGYGALDGTTDLSKLTMQGVISTIVWILCILIGVILSKKVIKFIKPVVFIVIISQVALIIPSAINAKNVESKLATKDDIDENREVYLTVEDMKHHHDMFNFSKDKNIIYIILDAFDYKAFEEVQNEEKIQKAFKDFTIYSNYASTIEFTIPSAMAQFAGKIIDNSIPYTQMKKESFTSGYSAPEVLKEKGWSNKFYTKTAHGIYYHTPKLYDSAYKVSNSNDSNFNPSEVNEIVNASYFKYMPHFLKNKFLINESINAWDFWFLDFVKNKQFKKQSVKPVFFTVHLFGMHPPLVIDKNMRIASKSNLMEQSYSALILVDNFLNKLKEIGVYDNSLIIITGDHGQGSPFNSHTSLMVKDINEKKEKWDFIDYPTSQIDMKDYIIKFSQKSEKKEGGGDFARRKNRIMSVYINRDNTKPDFFGVIEKVIVPDNIKDTNKFIRTGQFYYPYSVGSIKNKDIVIDRDNYESYKSFFIGNWNVNNEEIIGTSKQSKLQLAFDYDTYNKNNYVRVRIKLNEKYHTCNNEKLFKIIDGIYDYNCKESKIDIYIDKKTLSIDFLTNVHVKSIEINFLNRNKSVIWKDIHKYACHGCERTLDGIVLYKNNIQIGPYITLDKGEYKITITGDNLDNGTIDVRSFATGIGIKPYNINISKNKIEYTFKLDDAVQAIDYRLRNPSDLPITITSITREKIN